MKTKEKKKQEEQSTECPVCRGAGKAYFSCCTGDIVDEDIKMCPKCHEWLGETDCEECGGTGVVK